MCILQKNNCMGNSAKMPIYPDPKPFGQFRNQLLTFETAEDIFIGHLKLRENENNNLINNNELLQKWSWKVGNDKY